MKSGAREIVFGSLDRGEDDERYDANSVEISNIFAIQDDISLEQLIENVFLIQQCH